MSGEPIMIASCVCRWYAYVKVYGSGASLNPKMFLQRWGSQDRGHRAGGLWLTHFMASRMSLA